jgi:hypothetical protein
MHACMPASYRNLYEKPCRVLQNGSTCHATLQHCSYWRIFFFGDGAIYKHSVDPDLWIWHPPACSCSVPLKERWCRERAQAVYNWKCHRQYHGWEHLYTCLSKHDQENWYVCIQSNGGDLQRVVWTLVCGFRPVRHEMRFVFRYLLERIVLLRGSFTVRTPPRVFSSHRVRYFSQKERIPVIYCCLNKLTLQVDELNVLWTIENCNTFLCWIKVIIICITRLCRMLITTRCSLYICPRLSTRNEVNKMQREREREITNYRDLYICSWTGLSYLMVTDSKIACLWT